MYADRYRFKVTEISEKTGMSVGAIYRVLEKYGINPHRSQHPDRSYLVAQYAHVGTPARKIAELTGYSTRQVYNLLKQLTD